LPSVTEENNAVTRDQRPPGRRPSALLTVVSGPVAGEVLEVRDAVVLGRDCDLSTCFEETGVSRAHARIWCSALGAFHIEDLESTNGTFINDLRVERRALVVGDEVRLGPALKLRFTLSPDRETAA
jgi:pSer/pThr/pTyr-binding forkhead associated (FHA) protein